MRRIPLILLLCGALVAGLLSSGLLSKAPAYAGTDGVALFPFGLMEKVRRTDLSVPMQVQLYNGGSQEIQLLSLDVRSAAGAPLDRLDLYGEWMVGDDGDYLETARLMEVVHPDITHKHENRIFVPLEEREDLPPGVESELVERIVAGVDRLKTAAAKPVKNVSFQVDLTKLFPAGSQAGDVADFDIAFHYRAEDGRENTIEISQRVQWIPGFLPPPAEYASGAPDANEWVAGDLHVHNCRDEASGGCPDCAAESFNTSAAFTNADLKQQFVALGIKFFSTSTHSYCINDQVEFNNVVLEANSLDDPAFAVLLGTEVSGQERGPQTGSDSADALCFLGGGDPVHHMGAHAIQNIKPGGKDGFLDFCDDPITGVISNTAQVNLEGGFAIANHPADDFFAFNSTDQARGIEANGLRGVEIWNGAEARAQPNNVQWWVDRMLDDRVLYCYSGSDTHGSAFDFGANRALVNGSFSEAKVVDALRMGRHYLSNGPFLAIVVEDNRGRSLDMGAVINVKASKIPNNFPVTVRVFYNTSSASRIRVYKGRVGDAAESLLQETSGLTGSGELQVQTTVENLRSSWYRADLVRSDGVRAAYSNPIFIRLK